MGAGLLMVEGLFMSCDGGAATGESDLVLKRMRPPRDMMVKPEIERSGSRVVVELLVLV